MRVSLAQMMRALEQKTLSAYVLYGSNTTLIQGVLHEIKASFSYETVSANDLGAYRDDLDTPLLFGSKPCVVHVEGAIQWPKIGPILRAWPHNHAVVACSTSVPLPWSKSPEIAILPCYDCTIDDSKFMVSRAVVREKIQLDPETVQVCAELTQWGQWHSVMSVLSLAAGNESPLKIHDLHQLFPEPWDETAVAILDAPGMAYWTGPVSDPIPMIRSWQRIMLQLLQYQHFSNSLGSDGALSAVRPSVFFKHKTRLINASHAWSKKRIIRCLGQLMQGEIAIKKNLGDANTLLDRLIRYS